MSIFKIVMISFFSGAALQLLFRRLPVSIVVPAVVLSLWILFTEFLQPYKGGGASMWPIAVLFIIIYSVVGASCGALPIAAITKTGKLK